MKEYSVVPEPEASEISLVARSATFYCPIPLIFKHVWRNNTMDWGEVIFTHSF